MRPEKEVVLFGEILMRLAPEGFDRFVQAEYFDARFTGAEANVGVSLVNFGIGACVVSRLPDNEIGQAGINYLRRYGIDTRYISRGGERLGLFYLETGSSQRPSKIIYDRANSAMCGITGADVDWTSVLSGKDWLHFSGTAPALGPNVRSVLEEGLSAANKLGLTVSCDLNYRAKLWSPEEAQRTMSKLVPYVDVLIGNEEDTEKMLGIRAEGANVEAGTVPEESYREVSKRLVEEFGFRYVATTLRESISASKNRWSALLSNGADCYSSRKYEIDPIVDRVGAGDSFSGGLIYGLLSGLDGQLCVEFAAAASCLKHSIRGDFNLVRREEVEALLKGGGSGRVQR